MDGVSFVMVIFDLQSIVVCCIGCCVVLVVVVFELIKQCSCALVVIACFLSLMLEIVYFPYPSLFQCKNSFTGLNFTWKPGKKRFAVAAAAHHQQPFNHNIVIR